MTMARGSRKKSTDEQLAEVEKKIKEYQEQKKQLLAQREQEDIQALLDAAKEAGISPAELVKQLKAQKEASPSDTI